MAFSPEMEDRLVDWNILLNKHYTLYPEVEPKEVVKKKVRLCKCGKELSSKEKTRCFTCKEKNKIDYRNQQRNTKMFSKLEGVKVTVDMLGQQYNCKLHMTKYENGRHVMQLIDADGSPFATATVNVPHSAIHGNELLMKFWTENEYIREPLLKTGLFIDTKGRINTGYVQAEIWRLK